VGKGQVDDQLERYLHLQLLFGDWAAVTRKKRNRTLEFLLRIRR